MLSFPMQNITKLAEDFFHSFSTGKLRLSVARYFANDRFQIPLARFGVERVYSLKEWRAVLAPLLTIENLIALVKLPYGHESNALAYSEKNPDADVSEFIVAVRLRMAILDVLFGNGWSLHTVRVKRSSVNPWNKTVSRSTDTVTVLCSDEIGAIRAAVRLYGKYNKFHSVKVVSACKTYGYSEEFITKFGVLMVRAAMRNRA